MNIYSIIMRPEIWLSLLVITGPGIELVPCVRAFREEQEKLPRFSDVPSVGASDWWISLGWLGPFTSVIMFCASIVYGIKHDSNRNLLVGLVLIPVAVLATILVQNHASNQNSKRIDLGKIATWNMILIQYVSVMTTAIYYLILICDVRGGWDEIVQWTKFSAIMSTLSVSALALVTTVGGIICGGFRVGQPDEDPQKLKKNAKSLVWQTCLFNPILSPLTVPITVVSAIVLVVGNRLGWKWAYKITNKLP